MHADDLITVEHSEEVLRCTCVCSKEAMHRAYLPVCQHTMIMGVMPLYAPLGTKPLLLPVVQEVYCALQKHSASEVLL